MVNSNGYYKKRGRVNLRDLAIAEDCRLIRDSTTMIKHPRDGDIVIAAVLSIVYIVVCLQVNVNIY
jgi:hypothetical protein